jgi:hypothetical protein
MLTDPQAWLSNHKGLVFGIPILGGTVSFLPSYVVATLLAPHFGIDISAPLMPQPHGLLFLNVFLLTMAVFAFCGFFVGSEIVVRILMRRFNLNWRDGWREFKSNGWGKAQQ